MSGAAPFIYVIGADRSLSKMVSAEVASSTQVAQLGTANEAASLALARPPHLLMVDGDTATAVRDIRICRRDPALAAVPVVVCSTTSSTNCGSSERVHEWRLIERWSSNTG